MQARRTLSIGQKGTKTFLGRYGGQLICIRIRCDEQRRGRGATVGIIVEESGWSPPEKPAIVGLRIDPRKLNCSVVSNRRVADGIPQSEFG